MTKRARDAVFKTTIPRAETMMDKTTRIVREIIGEETEQRQTSMARLRKARLEMEAAAAADAPESPKSPSGGAGKKPPVKAVR